MSEVADRHFERLYHRYARDVYRFVLAVVRNPTEAEDVTQTAFLNAYKAYKRGERPERPRSWLIAIAHNAIRSRYRFRMRRPKEVPLDEAVLDLPVAAEERESVAEVLDALGELPENQREALAMRELEGRSYDEIAQTLGVTVPAVESLIFRARRTLRKQRTSLRGLTVVQLPRSLRTLFQSQPDAVGAGLTAKAAVVIAAASVMAGGVLGSNNDAGASQHPTALGRHEPSRPHFTTPQPQRTDAVFVLAEHVTAQAAVAAAKTRRPGRRTPPPAAPAIPPSPAPAAPTSTTSTGAPEAQPAAAAPDPTPAAGPAARSGGVTSTIPTAQAAVTAAVATIPVPTVPPAPQVPQLPAPQVPPPSAVTVPAVPSPPSLPTPPPLPQLPSVPQVPGPGGIK